MSLFTIEQIELVRRLRLTGITPQQIIEAFQIFDRLDQELIFTRTDFRQITSAALTPHILASAHAHPFTSASVGPSFLNCATSGGSIAEQLPTTSNNDASGSPNTPKSSRVVADSQRSRQNSISTSPSAINFFNDSMPTMIDCIPNGVAYWPQALSMEAEYSKNSASGKVGKNKSRNFSPEYSSTDQKVINMSVRATLENMERTDPEIAKEIDELIAREESAIVEIRDYVTANQLRQQAIAQMCGISQPYVSKFLNGSSNKDLSERVRRLIFHWYIKSKMESPDYVKVVVSSGEPAQLKRERFFFKPVHVNLLEKFFEQDSYPNLSRREEICSDLNNALITQKGGLELDDKEIVAEHVVSTWFSNKRREKKKRDYQSIKSVQYDNIEFLENLSAASGDSQKVEEKIQSAITVDDEMMDDGDDVDY